MLGLILYLSTTAWFTPRLLALAVIVACFRFIARGRHSFAWLSVSETLGLAMLLWSGVMAVSLFLLETPQVLNLERSILGAFPFVVLIVLSICIALVVTRFDLYVLLGAVFIEIFVGVAEFLSGVHSFLTVPFLRETLIAETSLLYYRRVYGLSLNSSDYAFKVLMAFIVVLSFKAVWPRRIWWLTILVITAGFITSFGRTALVAALAGWIIFNYKDRKILLATLTLLFAFALVFHTQISSQLLRNRGLDELSGRQPIHEKYVELLQERPFVGNAASKAWFVLEGQHLHAHNSYLQLVASNGLLVSAVFLVGYYLLVLRERLPIAATMLVYCAAQYGIWWGLSFNDIVFCAVMLNVARRRSGQSVADPGPLERTMRGLLLSKTRWKPPQPTVER